MRRSLAPLGAGAALLAMVACGAIACGPVGDADQELLGRGSDAIVNGMLDTTHQAVVAYLQGGKCSATIIDVVGNQGYALTAAHCINSQMGVLRQGNNHANNQYDVQYTVVDTEIHPLYNESGLYDFAVVRFSGANGSTPVIPPLAPAQDNIVQGTVMDLVGYGQTENGGTSLRHHINRPVNFQTALRLNYNQQSGGMCSGDSGGAALHTVGNTEYVGGVNSFVAGDCTTSGTAVRVSAVHDTFIMPYINGTPYQPQNCDQCSDAHIFNGACTQDVINCFDNADCSAYISCIQNCSTQSCVVSCGAQHPTGKGMYEQIFSCLCTGPCATECAGDQQCEPPPACGLTSSNAACQTCFEASCCGEASACAGDAECINCVTAIAPGPECQDNPNVQGLNACLAESCAEPCNVNGGSGGGGSGGSGAGTGGSGVTSGTGGGVTSGAGGAGPEDDGGEPLVIDESCACAVPGRGGQRPGGRGWLLALLPLALVWRRRR